MRHYRDVRRLYWRKYNNGDSVLRVRINAFEKYFHLITVGITILRGIFLKFSNVYIFSFNVDYLSLYLIAVAESILHPISEKIFDNFVPMSYSRGKVRLYGSLIKIYKMFTSLDFCTIFSYNL